MISALRLLPLLALLVSSAVMGGSMAAEAPAAASLVEPLLATGTLPRFRDIRAEQVVPAVRRRIDEVEANFVRLEREVAPSWDATIGRLTACQEPLTWTWSVVNHLLAVRNSPELRAAHQAVLPSVVALNLRMGQSRPFYEALVVLRTSPGFQQLDEAQRRVVTIRIRDAEHNGVRLTGEEKLRFNRNAQELADLSSRFQNHVLDATKAYALDLRQADEIAGLPSTARQTAATAWAMAHGGTADAEHGPWRITLAGPGYQPFMEHARRRDLRERLYRAFVTRASSGSTDNLPLVERTLALRREQASLLGYGSYAELSVAEKMAGSVAAVERLLDELRTAALPKARHELVELNRFAAERSGDAPYILAPWDIPFWSERLRESRHDLDDERVRPYFALPQVLTGLFAVTERLFDVRIRAADGEAQTWHDDVRFFRVSDAQGRDIAAFYLDSYSRPADKRGGAWMDSCLDRCRTPAGLRLPVAYLNCNQTPPAGATPSLMTFNEVRTLFHEFGHGLQHMLTTVDRVEAAGLAHVEWDAVEFPSLFMENWCFDRTTVVGRPGVPGIGRHWRTGESIPEELFTRLCAARTFLTGTATTRHVFQATIDLELHHRYVPGPGASVLEEQRRMAAAGLALPLLEEDRFLCAFTHIFSNSYAAGYYSYKWAGVLSADAFQAFRPAGPDDDAAVRATGRRFRDTVLALGGTRHPLDIFKAFRGRQPTTEALLIQDGLR